MANQVFYHISGSIQALIFLLSLAAIVVQARVIRIRKATSLIDRIVGSTDVISLNLIMSSFFAFFSYLLYGAALERANYYLVFTRLPACILTTYIVFEIAVDRRTALARACLWTCLVATSCALVAVAVDREIFANVRHLFSKLVLVCGVVMFQGQAHQIFRIIKSKSTGAISFKARFLNVLKDVSTVIFAVAMGFKDGWPLIVVNGINAIMTMVVLKSFDKYGPQALPNITTLQPTDSRCL